MAAVDVPPAPGPPVPLDTPGPSVSVPSAPPTPRTPRLRSTSAGIVHGGNGPESAGPSTSPAGSTRRRSRPSWWTEEHEAPATRTARSSVSSAPRSSAPPAADAAPAPTTTSAPALAPMPALPPRPDFLQPWAFYPLNNQRTATEINDPVPVPEGEWLSPEDDRHATRGIPVFKPTMEEFQDFEGYATKTVPWGQYSGIVKVIPPDEWVRNQPAMDKRQLAEVRIKSPIQQNMIGKSGVYMQTNVEKMKNKPMSVHQWFDKCHDKIFTGPSPKDIDYSVDRDSKEAKERRAAIEAEIKADRMAKREKRQAALLRKQARMEEEANGHGRGSVGTEDKEEVEQQLVDALVTPVKGSVDSPMSGKDQDAMAVDADLDTHAHPTPSQIGAANEGVPPLDSGSRSSAEPAEPAPTTPPQESPLDPFYETDMREAWLPPNARPEDYTADACAKIERKFWRTLGVGEPSWYGADLQGTLFPDRNTPWNVANLPNLLNRPGLTTLPGVNSPYLYFGMWRAAFAWHVEDMDLFSINYIHFGAPKFWYAIPQLQAEQFERVVAGYFPANAQQCDQFMRHKSCTISPTSLAKDNIRVNMLVHKQNEFVITYPRGYHAGFNLGFNCAESINFALDSWIELGRRAKACECVDFSVRIDVDALLAEQNLVKAIQEERAEKAERVERKSKKDKEKDGTPTQRKRKRTKGETENEDFESAVKAEEELVEDEVKPKIKIPVVRARKPTTKVINVSTNPDAAPTITHEKVVREKEKEKEKEKLSFPCIFCPSLDESDLAPVKDINEAVLAHMSKAKTKIGDDQPRGHISCALGCPELYLDEKEVDGVKSTSIMGIDYVIKDRWTLKCASCKDKQKAKMGIKIQCTKGKCPRAFHVSCATNDETVELSVRDEVKQMPVLVDGIEPSPDQPVVFEDVEETIVELFCPTHNPNMIELKRRKEAEELRQRVLALEPETIVKFRKSGTYWAVPFVRVLEETQQVLVRLETGVEAVNWKALDLRPREAQVIENEYARPAKRSRKESGDIAASVGGQGRIDIANLVHAPLAASQLLPRLAPMPVPLAQPPPHRLPNFFGSPGYPPPTEHRPVPLDATRQHMYDRVHIVDSKRGPSHYAECFHDHQSLELVPVSPLSVPISPRGYPGPSHSRFFDPTALAPAPAHFAPPPSSFALGRLPPTARIPPMHPAFARAPVGFYPLQPSSHRSPMQSAMPPAGPPSFPPFQASSFHSGSQGFNNVPRPGQGPPPPSAPGGVGKIDLGLDRMEALMRILPPLNVPAIHLAGTNGKGSVSAILESCLRASGLSVARYNSPHLLEPRDAIRLNGSPPSREAYALALGRVQQISATTALQATTFEIATAAAYLLIAEHQPPIDVMIIECGMGGQKDATNVIPPNMIMASGLTSVGLDHMDFLGNTIAEIATQKASIAVPGGYLFVAPRQHPDVLAVVSRLSASRGFRSVESLPSVPLSESPSTALVSLEPFAPPLPTPVRTPVPLVFESPSRTAGVQPFINTRFSLGGEHQLDNLSLAVTILHVLRLDARALTIQPKLRNVTDTRIEQGVAATRWEGRCSWVQWTQTSDGRKYPLLVDGAHNADSALLLRKYIDSLGLPPDVPTTFIVALSHSPSKPVSTVLTPLVKPNDRVVAVNFTTPVEGMPWVSAAPKESIRLAAQGLIGPGGEASVVEDKPQARDELVEALQHAVKGWQERPGLVVVCGSLYLVADVYRLLRGD